MTNDSIAGGIPDDYQRLMVEHGHLWTELATLRSKQDHDAMDLKDAIRDMAAAIEARIDSIMVYIAMKERGNEREAELSRLYALLAMEDEGGLYSMHRFVSRYKDAFIESAPRHLGY